MERSGTFRLDSIDPIWSRSFKIPAPAGPLPTYHITFRTEERIPCPSLWRHPLRWLRWNPFQTIRLTVSFPAATVEWED